MGPVSSAAAPHSNAFPFVNLPKEAILSLWLSYNLLGEGWALTSDQFVAIFKEANYIHTNYSYGDDQLAKLFVVFDTDSNGLVDALEIFVTIGLLSGMDALDKLNFAFSAFDLEAKGSLSRDETNLLFRTLIKGLQKASPTNSGYAATQSDAAKFAELLFSNGAPLGRLFYDEFQSYCVTHPVISSWIRSVASFDEKDRVVEAGVKDPDARSEWVAALDDIFSADAHGRRARRHILSAEDILQDLERENLIQNHSDDISQPWIEKVQYLKPEEAPAPQRWDLPEDLIESSWVAGINTRRIPIDGKPNSFVEARIHRSARYRSEDSDSVLFAAGNNVLSMKKNEETLQWTQELGNAHDCEISCFDLHLGKDLLVTAEIVAKAMGPQESSLVLWKLSTLSVRKRINCPYGVKFLDINANGNLALVVFSDPLSSVTIYNLDSGLAVFSKQLLLNDALSDRVTDARFFGTSSMFAVSSTKMGVRFFVNEDSGIMGKGNMQLFEERPPLFGVLGKEVKNASILCLCRMDAIDEMACGTEAGHIILWRGRTAAQVLEAHRGPVLALDFHSASRTLVSGGKDGGVKIYEVTIDMDKTDRKGPKPVPMRSLVCTASFDILRHPLLDFSIGALALSKDASKLLIVTSSSDMLEVRAKIAPPTQEELEEAAAAAADGGEEGAVPVSKGQLGDDLHGGSIISGHFLDDGSVAEKMPAIVCACKMPAGGFVTCGADRSARLWQMVGDGEGSGAYKSVRSILLDCPASAAVATAASLFVALKSSTSPRNGVIQIFALPDATASGEIVDVKQAIRFLLTNGDGNLVVVICEDGSVKVFGLAEGSWTLKGSLSLTAAPSSADLSGDAQFLRVFAMATHDMQIFDIGANFGKELLVSIKELLLNAPKPTITVNEDGEEVEEPPAANPAAPLIEALRAVTWASNTCPYAFDSTGAKSLRGCSTFYDRSNSVLLSCSEDGVVAVDRVPSYNVTAHGPSRLFAAHVGPLSALQFIEEGGAKILTVGAVDGIVRVWKVAFDADEPEVDIPDPVPEEGEAVPPAEEGEEGKLTLPKIYDSGEEDDLLDLALMKKHIHPLTVEVKATGEDNENSLISAHLPPVLAPYAKSLNFPNTIELTQAAARMYKTDRAPVPTDEVKVQWIYGCSSRQTRNAVKYTAEGTIAYPAGTVAVVLDKIGKTQKHVFPHKDEITCLDVHLGKKIAASGHKGVGDVSVYLWKTLSGEVLRTLSCGTCNGISAIKFSPDGSLLAVACQDVDHTIKVFNVDDGALLAAVSGGDKKVLCLAFSDLSSSPGPTWRILQGGVKHFRILSYNVGTRSLTYKTGLFGADVRRSHVNCAHSLPLTLGDDGVASGNEFVLGMSDGTATLVARGENKAAGFTPCMTGPVTAVCVAKTKDATPEEPAVIKIVVGGTNGVIKVLDHELQPTAEWNLYAKDYGLQDIGRVRGFKSLSVDKLNRKILFSTSAGEIGELDLATGDDVNGAPVVSGHFRDRLMALATHPIRQECLTAGEDKTLRVWDLEGHAVIATIELPAAATCATFAPNGHLIVVGLSRRDGEEIGGRMAIVSYLQGKLRIVHVTSEPRDIIASLVFSPDGSKVFAASLDQVIYVYDALNNFIVITTLVGHQQGVKLLDVAQNGRVLVSQGVAYEIMVWDLGSFSAVTRPRDRFEALADVESHWSTRQTLLSPNSLGIFQRDTPVEETWSLAQSKDARLLAVGDQKGVLRLFACPSVQCYAPSKNYSLHSAGGLSGVSFTVEDHYLLTIGAHDKMMVQWKVIKGGVPPDDVTPRPPNAESSVAEDVYESSFVVKGIDFRTEQPNAEHEHLSAQLTHILGVGHGTALPSAALCGHGEIVTSLGKAIVALEEDGKKIRLWNFNAVSALSHAAVSRGNVDCVAASVSGRLVAVGTDGVLGKVALFGAPTGRLLVELSDGVAGGAASVAISLNDRFVACLGKDAHHSLYVFKTFTGEWNDALLIHKSQVSDSTVNLLSFSNCFASIGKEYASSDFVTAGKGRIRFWRIEGLNAISTPGNYGSEEIAQVTALARGAAAQVTISGDIKGRLLQWDGNYASVISAFSSPVTALVAFGLSGSGRTGVVVATEGELAVLLCTDPTSWTTSWQLTLPELVQRMDWTSALYSSGFLNRGLQVRSLATDSACKQVLLGLSCGALLGVATDSLSVRRVLEGHSSGAAVTQVLSMPTNPGVILTFCEDGAIRMWDTSEPSVVSGVSLATSLSTSRSGAPTLLAFSSFAHAPTSATFLNDNTLLVAVRDADAGAGSAAIFVMRVGITPSRKPELLVLHRFSNVGRGPIHQLRVSPENKFLAACSSDGCAYIYELSPLPSAQGQTIAEEGKPVGELVPGIAVFTALGFLLAHPSGGAVTCIDFSQDNKFMRTFGENGARINGKVEVSYFDFELVVSAPASTDPKVRRHAAGKVQDVGAIEAMKSVAWATAGSPAAPEARGLAYPFDSPDQTRPLAVSSQSISEDNKLVVAGYEDGSVRVFRFPAYSKFDAGCLKSSLKLDYHASGPVTVAFVKPVAANTYRLVTVGQRDGCVMVWTLA